MSQKTSTASRPGHVAKPLWRHLAIAAAITALWGAQAANASGATSIVFIGSSVTWGYTEVEDFGVGTVTDMNGCTETVGGCKPIGGVPAIFKAFTQQAGLHYDVYLEVVPGSTLTLHYDTKRALIDRAWDKVVMNGQTNLDFGAPGNPMRITNDVKLLGEMWKAHNPKVEVNLLSTWSRADLV
ncbi:MAG: exosortase interaction domain protein, partial [Rhizobacter sp.]|nr:exosortase interaction domain protein [Rhizobacter sp.]